MNFLKFYILIFCTLFFFTYSNVMAYEEANYEVVSSNEVYEIRKYSNRLAAETITTNQNNSFRTEKIGEKSSTPCGICRTIVLQNINVLN